MDEHPTYPQTDPATDDRGRRRKKLAIAACLLAVIWAAWHLWATRGYERAAGFYLTQGGHGFVEIHVDHFGHLTVTDGDLFREPKERYDGGIHHMSARFRNGRLILTQHHCDPVGDQDLFDTEGYPWLGGVHCGGADYTVALAPSAPDSRDWDATGIDFDMRGRHLGGAGFAFFQWEEFKDPHNYEAAFRQMVGLDPSKSFRQLFVHEESDPPLVSYLHRVDDLHAQDYIRARLRRPPSPEDLASPFATDDAAMRDPYLALLRIELQALVGDLDLARLAWEKWSETNSKSGAVLLTDAGQTVKRTIDWREFQRALGPIASADSLWPEVPGATSFYPDVRMTMGSANRWIELLLANHGLPKRKDLLIRPIGSEDPDATWERAHLRDFVCASCPFLMTEALFAAFRGDVPTSIQLAARSHRLAQMLLFDRRHWGRHACQQTTHHLETLLLNACETPDDLRSFIAAVTPMNLTSATLTALFARDWTLPPYITVLRDETARLMKAGKPALRTPGQTMTLADEAWFRLLGPAAAGKCFWKETGHWPATEADITERLGGPLPEDPFRPGQPLLLAFAPDGFAVYSVGPDGADDAARVDYSPKNRIDGLGDIVLRVGPEREFPFPVDGVRANTAADLLSQFPNGLPLNPSGAWEGWTLSVLDATSTQPLTLINRSLWGDEFIGPSGIDSPGPLVSIWENQWRRVTNPNLNPHPGARGYYETTGTLPVLYDPTNGLRSSGGLFMEIPRRSSLPD